MYLVSINLLLRLQTCYEPKTNAKPVINIYTSVFTNPNSLNRKQQLITLTEYGLTSTETEDPPSLTLLIRSTPPQQPHRNVSKVNRETQNTRVTVHRTLRVVVANHYSIFSICLFEFARLLEQLCREPNQSANEPIAIDAANYSRVNLAGLQRRRNSLNADT